MKHKIFYLNHDNLSPERIHAIEEDGFGNGILTVTAGTTGYCGGDSGHGGRSFVKFHMEGGDLCASIGDNASSIRVDDLIISVGGDLELDALIESFHYAAEALELITALKRELK